MLGLLRCVQRELVHSTPIVQLGLAPLGHGNDGVGTGIVFKLFETIQIVCADDFHGASLMDRASGILVEEVSEVGAKRGALENHVFEGHLGRALAIHDHLCSTLGTRQRDQCRVNSLASEFLQQTLGPNSVESPRHVRAVNGDFHAAIATTSGGRPAHPALSDPWCGQTGLVQKQLYVRLNQREQQALDNVRQLGSQVYSFVVAC